MRPGVVGLCAALSLAAVVVVVVAMIRDGDGVVRLRIRSCRYSRLVACLDVPRLALPYRALLCSLLCPDLRWLVKAACCTRCRRDEVQWNTVLDWICTCAPVSQSTVLLSQRSKYGIRQQLPGRQVDSKVQERGEQEHRWSLAPLCTREKRGRS